MRYAFNSIAALLLASTALAAPQRRNVNVVDVELDKRALVTHFYTITVTHTVYATGTPSSSSTTTTTTPAPAPDPSSSAPAAQLPDDDKDSIVVTTSTQKVEVPPPAPTLTSSSTTSPVAAPTTTSTTSPVAAPIPTSSSTTSPVAVPTPQPEIPPAGNQPSDFQKQYVDKHNELRAKHGAPPLEFDSGLASFAQGWVENCVWKHSGQHPENLANGHKSIVDAIQAWYNEEPNYDYDAGQFSSGTGHFTQVVWASATKIGCGGFNCPGGTGKAKGWFWSCNYDKGNLIGAFKDNVKRPVN